MGQETILIVDDEKEIGNLIEIYLKNENYNVVKVQNGVQALKVLENRHVDLIILDVLMPEMDGIQACMKIREKKNMPIIMLSAKSQDMDKIMGLASGADDYVTKPFNPLEIVARVKSQLRRYTRLNSTIVNKKEEIEVEGLLINTSTHEIKVDGKKIKVTPREFDILELLARNKGIVFSIEKIYEKIWKEDFLEDKNTVMVHIRKLREKIEENPRNPKYIITIWGVGYKIDG